MQKIMLLCVLVVLLILLFRWQVARMFYYPDHRVYDTPASLGLKYEPVSFPSRDGTRLSGCFVPAIGDATGSSRKA